VKIRSFNIKKKVCPLKGSSTEALSLEAVLLFIMAIGVSQIYIPKPFAPGHGHVDHDPYHFIFEDLINLICNFSRNDDPGRDTFFLSDT
jgi:hypothetical protein